MPTNADHRNGYLLLSAVLSCEAFSRVLLALVGGRAPGRLSEGGHQRPSILSGRRSQDAESHAFCEEFSYTIVLV